MASAGGIPPRVTHDPNSGLLRPNRVKRLLAAGGTAFIAAGELNWTGDRSAVQDTLPIASSRTDHVSELESLFWKTTRGCFADPLRNAHS